MSAFFTRAACLSLMLLLLAGCGQPEAEGPAAVPEDGPRLVLFLVVDQMRAEYLDRFGSLFTGGLGRVMKNSVRFTDAHQFHATTETAPGHATLSTGLFPRHHGIVANYWFDRELDDFAYAVSDEEFGRSPRNLQGTTLGSWMKAANRDSKVFAASGKDRSALLTAGLEADGAFWYDRDDGTFTSTEFYYPDDSYPEWLEAFNKRGWMDQYFAKPWEPVAAAAEAGEELGISDTDLGPLTGRFPHALGGLTLRPNEPFYDSLYSTPMVDAYLAELGKALIEGEGLGQDEVVDFLGLSFSATDTVGHDFGPNSREVLDTLLKLDRVLGELLDFVDQKVGLEHVIVSLSADHGVMELPEYLRDHEMEGRRLVSAEALCFQSVGADLKSKFGDEAWLMDDGYFDEALIAEKGLELEDFENEARRLLEACPGVDRVWTRAELELPAAAEDAQARLFVNVLHPERRANFYIQWEPYFMPVSSYPTTHGSPHRYDTHVPWLLWLPEGQPGTVADFAMTADVAPTIGALLGTAAVVPDNLDGSDRSADLMIGGRLAGEDAVRPLEDGT